MGPLAPLPAEALRDCATPRFVIASEAKQSPSLDDLNASNSFWLVTSSFKQLHGNTLRN